MDVATYTKRLFNRWGVGRRSINDGVVLLAAPREHKARITVGYGLEAVLTDATCQIIMDREMIWHFAAGRFGRGFEAGIAAVIAKLDAAER